MFVDSRVYVLQVQLSRRLCDGMAGVACRIGGAANTMGGATGTVCGMVRAAGDTSAAGCAAAAAAAGHAGAVSACDAVADVAGPSA